MAGTNECLAGRIHCTYTTTMTTGALIFAFNNEHIDYVSLAAWSAKNIHRHLHIPVCIVTDIDLLPTNHTFDQVVHLQPQPGSTRQFADIDGNVIWYNADRVDAYNISPWQQTLVLDADYVVASNQLSTLFSANQDFLAHSCAYDITNLRDFDDLNYFGQHRMPMSWATVMLFRRSSTADLIFKSMRMVRDHWPHYVNLYANTRSAYRNDHALTIAQSLVNGHVLTYPVIPWDLASITPEHTVIEVGQDNYRVEFVTAQQQPRWITLQGQDFHAMGKRHLGDIVANSQ